MKTLVILLGVTLAVLAFGYVQQRHGKCDYVFPFASLLSEHRVNVDNQKVFSKELKEKLENEKFNVRLEVHRNFKRVTEKGLGKRYTTYGTLACSQQAIVISDNIEKEGQQLITFHYNWLYGDEEARRIRTVILN